MLRGTRLELGRYPTPVDRVDALSRAGSTLWVKRDDLTSEAYGGNKVRKLELFLGAARDAGKRRIVTLGAVGSHQVVATALYGAREGFEVEAVLVPQPRSLHAELNLRAALSLGVRAIPAPAWALGPAVALGRLGRDAYFVPLGGSNTLGSLGFVDAARELAAQVRAGVLAEPDVVVVALGSGGTAAGLAAGLEREGLRTRVLGVAVSEPSFALGVMARRLARKAAAAAGSSPVAAARAAARIDVDGRWVGRGYGHAIGQGHAAREAAGRAGIALDPTYTEKAFACALALLETGRHANVLFWHTLSRAPIEPLVREGLHVPARLARLLR